MSLDQVIGIIGQIATWVTVLFVFLTLREMERQRKASQKPELIIPKVPLFGYIRKGNALPVPTEWINKEIKGDDELTKKSFAVVTLYNIGFGAAKNIILNWRFDTQNILQTIKDYCYQNSIPIVVGIEKGFLRVETKNSRSMTNLSLSVNREHEYLMPTSVISSGLESALPPPFMEILAIFMYMMMHQESRKSDSIELNLKFEFPPLKLELTYEDIGGGKYKKEFDVRFSIFMFVLPEHETEISEKEPMVKGAFEFTEVDR